MPGAMVPGTRQKISLYGRILRVLNLINLVSVMDLLLNLNLVTLRVDLNGFKFSKF